MEHKGHRKRLYEKLKAGGLLHDHELLEMLLFNAYPRKNTNPIAHKLLDTFGSLRGVFDANIEELCAVKDVGENIACYLKTVGMCSYGAYSAEGNNVTLRNYGDFKDYASVRLRSMTEEAVEIYVLDRAGKIKYVYSHSVGDKHRVRVNHDEITRLISGKPYGIVMAHNHLTGSSEPSAEDDKFTGEVQVLCGINGVRLFDHCIYAADNDVYSYFATGRIDQIKNSYNLNTLKTRV